MVNGLNRLCSVLKTCFVIVNGFVQVGLKNYRRRDRRCTYLANEQHSFRFFVIEGQPEEIVSALFN
jgi:hypothetical protein